MRELKAEKARRSLHEFVRQAFGVVEPGTAFVDNWHIKAICEHLEAVTNGDIRNLVINIPPRHTKSMTVSVLWQAWVWITHPETAWLCSSYAQPLATRDSLKCRRLLMSEWYQERWGHAFNFAGDQNIKTRFENDEGGFRISMGVKGGATGEGGDYIIADDPHKVQEKESRIMLDAVADWWFKTMATRVRDPKTARKVVVMQRIHEGDLTGRILTRMAEGEADYTVLILPMRFEGDKTFTDIGWQDPREEQGELLCPQRFPEEEVQKWERELGPSDSAGQLQQRPAPPGGAVFLREYWDGQNRWDGELNTVARYMSIDTANKEEEQNAYSAVSVWDLLADYRIALKFAWREKLPFPKLIEQIHDFAEQFDQDGKLKGIVIEDKQSGISATQTLRSGEDEHLGRMIVPFSVSGDKVYRARQASVWCSRGCVLLPYPDDERPWLYAFEHEIFNFPASAFMDFTDTFSQIIIYMEHFLSTHWHRKLKRG